MYIIYRVPNSSSPTIFLEAGSDTLVFDKNTIVVVLITLPVSPAAALHGTWVYNPLYIHTYLCLVFFKFCWNNRGYKGFKASAKMTQKKNDSDSFYSVVVLPCNCEI